MVSIVAPEFIIKEGIVVQMPFDLLSSLKKLIGVSGECAYVFAQLNAETIVRRFFNDCIRTAQYTLATEQCDVRFTKQCQPIQSQVCLALTGVWL